MVGLYKRFTPKFVKQYANIHDMMKKAVEEYGSDVKQGRFPEDAHSFTMKKDVVDKLSKIV